MRMRLHRIALYPGDGIGVDVTKSAVAVREAVSRDSGYKLAFTRFDWGIGYYERHGVVAPADFIATLRGFETIFLGAVERVIGALQ